MANKIAILSGKGGTGKTMLAVNLAAALNDCYYLDCDVEEPNGHLFFRPQNVKSVPVNVKIPKVDESLCKACKACVNFCKFNAIAYAKKWTLFSEICHSCGGCQLVCPNNAISEVDKNIGVINLGNSKAVKTVSGVLNIGEASGVPVINAIISSVENKDGVMFIDCPPGSSCVVMDSIKDADLCILVAEPTIFGAHNLEMVYELVRLFNKPCKVVLNKCTDGFNASEEFAKKVNLEILAKIPYCAELSKINSKGEIAVRNNYFNLQIFYELLKKIGCRT